MILREAIVLAGGRGTRLAPVVSDVPKPLARVAGRPFLDHLLDRLVAAGVERVVVSAGHLAARLQQHVDGPDFEKYRSAMEVTVVVEDRPLGTGGALVAALERVTSPTVLAMNGDALVVFDAAALAARHRERAAAVTLLASRVDDRAAYGSLELAADGRVLAFREKSVDVRGPGWVNAGVYAVERAALAPWAGRAPLSLERDVFPALEGLYALPGDFPFLDIGTPDTYRAAEAWLAAHPARGERCNGS